jgi:hypothetical protein
VQAFCDDALKKQLTLELIAVARKHPEVLMRLADLMCAASPPAAAAAGS